MSEKIYYFGEDYNYEEIELPIELKVKCSNMTMCIYPTSDRLLTYNNSWNKQNLFFSEQELLQYLQNSYFSNSLKKRMIKLSVGFAIHLCNVSSSRSYYLVCLDADNPLFQDLATINRLKNQASEIRLKIKEQTKELQKQLNSINNEIAGFYRNRPYIKEYK
jgi:hypothetical protein